MNPRIYEVCLGEWRMIDAFNYSQRLNTSLMIVGIYLIMGQLTPIRKLHDLWLPLRVGHLLELASIEAQSGERLGTRRRWMDEKRTPKTVVKLATIVRVIPEVRSDQQSCRQGFACAYQYCPC
jgi:hypothetical protein